MMKKIVLATNNPGKVKEFQALFQPFDIEIIPQSKFNIVAAEETGLTFIENAILKARHACHETGLPAIADDSGLVVDALGGAPGIYSARFAGQDVTQKAHIDKLLTALKEIPVEMRSARFVTVLVWLKHAKDPMPTIAIGTWEGKIALEPVGKHGFGYDPVFYVPELHCTAAELDSIVKNRLSHRGKAMRQLMDLIKRRKS